MIEWFPNFHQQQHLDVSKIEAFVSIFVHLHLINPLETGNIVKLKIESATCLWHRRNITSRISKKS